MTARARVHVGIASCLVMSAWLVSAGPVAAATFTVNRIGDQPDLNLANAACDVSTNTGNQCTLRAAIQEANDTPGADTINFNISTASKTIAPNSPLPEITDRVTINGYSQSGASPNTRANGNDAVLRIILDGLNAGDANGLHIGATGVTVRGLVIQRFEASGILAIGDGDSATISGNFIGTTAAGTAARGNGTGIRLVSSGHLIGGSNPGQRNLISGNVGAGLFLDGTDGGSSIHGNYIGTDRHGTAALGNGTQGIRVNGPNTRIGGTTAGAGNLISGNLGDGILITGAFSQNVSGNLVQGNRIGTDRSGNAGLGNGAIGVHLQDTEGTLVGGTTAAARNLISGNAHSGIAISGDDGSTVQGNFIGTRSDGTGDLGNGHYGVAISGASDIAIGGSVTGSGNIISGNTIDGIATSSGVSVTIRGNLIRLNDRDGIGPCANGAVSIVGNLIIANARDGVRACSDAPTVRISSNSILGNGGLGINLSGAPENADKVNPNDTDDPDTGANGRQNYPVLISAFRSNGTGVTTVTGTLNSTANTSFRIELFVAAADASGHGEGMTFIAAQTITTDAGGDKGFTFASNQLPVGTVLTSTATQQSLGATSEFSQNRVVAHAP